MEEFEYPSQAGSSGWKLHRIWPQALNTMVRLMGTLMGTLWEQVQ
jgi:hypothetical protein